MSRRLLLTGCSGGGKSTLLAALRAAGEDGVDEPGRRVIAAQRACGGGALPWSDLHAFLDRAFELAHADLAGASAAPGRIFFDRGLLDAAVGLEHLTGRPAADLLEGMPRYHRSVFVAPPCEAWFATDTDRRHGFSDAVAEHERIVAALPRLGYDAIILPMADVATRLAFVLARS